MRGGRSIRAPPQRTSSDFPSSHLHRYEAFAELLPADFPERLPLERGGPSRRLAVRACWVLLPLLLHSLVAMPNMHARELPYAMKSISLGRLNEI